MPPPPGPAQGCLLRGGAEACSFRLFEAEKTRFGTELLKNFFRSAFGQTLLAALAAGYMRFAYATTRWQTLGNEHPENCAAVGKPFIGCFWHQRMLMLPPIWAHRRNLHMLISTHADGILIARTIAHFGVRTIEGSTNRGAAAALRMMVEKLRLGEQVAVTPDGPRGPARKAAPGVASAAMLAQAVVIPVAYSVSRARFMRSWDRMLIPLPFSRGVMIWGEPIAPPAARADVEAFSRDLETRLEALCVEADRRVGLAAP
jgi:lysophospholipid acyltransferase (LPLAT)-like uncharacterized protein